MVAILVFLLQNPRIPKKLAYALPYLILQNIGADLGTAANSVATEPVTICSRAPIVAKIRQITSFPPLPNSLAVKGVSTEGTTGQTLQKMTWPSLPQASARTILTKLLLGGLERSLVHYRGCGYKHPLLLIDGNC